MAEWSMAHAWKAGGAWVSPPSQQPTITRLTSAGEMIGTGAYMSPEQVRGEQLDGRSDLFSCSTVIFLPTIDSRRAYFLLAHEVFTFCR
jgi:serine/threonine protein kinase